MSFRLKKLDCLLSIVSQLWFVSRSERIKMKVSNWNHSSLVLNRILSEHLVYEHLYSPNQV